MFSAIQPKAGISPLKQLLLSVLVILAFSLIYLTLVGIPKTRARNLYNQAELAANAGDSQTEVTRLLQEAYAAWPEDYIADYLAKYK